jgi:hypothetical protein
MDKMVKRGRLSIHLQNASKLSKEWGEGQLIPLFHETFVWGDVRHLKPTMVNASLPRGRKNEEGWAENTLRISAVIHCVDRLEGIPEKDYCRGPTSRLVSTCYQYYWRQAGWNPRKELVGQWGL